MAWRYYRIDKLFILMFIVLDFNIFNVVSANNPKRNVTVSFYSHKNGKN